MKRYKSLLRSVIILAALFVSLYFIACDVSESVAVNTTDQCDANNTAELTISSEIDSYTYSVYLDGTYLGTVKKGLPKVVTVSAGVTHKVEYKVDSAVKCAVNKNLTKCTAGTISCGN